MIEIDKIFDSKYSSPKARTKYIRIDCEQDNNGKQPTLIRFRLPYEVVSSPNGPLVEIKWDDSVYIINDEEERNINRREIPEEVQQKAQELRGKIGNW